MGVDADTREEFYTHNFVESEFFKQYPMWSQIEPHSYKNTIGETIKFTNETKKIEFGWGGVSKMVVFYRPLHNNDLKRLCKIAEVTLEYEKDGTSARIKKKRNT